MHPVRTLKNAIKHRTGNPLGLFLGSLLRLSGRRAGLALMYHRVGNVQGDPERELVPALGISLFEAQLAHLRRRYTVVPPSKIHAAAAGRRRLERFPIAITFDDDLESHATAAMPVLHRLQLPAAFFICGASLQTSSTFWWERLQAAVDRGLAKPAAFRDFLGVRAGLQWPRESIHRIAVAVEAMAPQERDAFSVALGKLVGQDPSDGGLRAEAVRGLADAGFEVGFHTLRHDSLPAIDDEALQAALTHGRADVAAAAGRQVTMIAYPHGRADRRVADAARSAGYVTGFTGTPEAVTSDTDPLLVGRLEPSFASTGHFALQLVRLLARQSGRARAKQAAEPSSNERSAA
jgi:peptidoglycan/xylan/chitin deacetylase (PgdA/CDA1 family)